MHLISFRFISFHFISFHLITQLKTSCFVVFRKIKKIHLFFQKSSLALIRSSGRAAAAGLKPLRLPRAPDDNASVLPPTLVRSLPIACAWSRSLSLFLSALVCDLLPRRLFHGFAKGALPEEYLSHNFDEHCLEDNRLIWCLSNPSGGAVLIPGRYVSW